MPGRVLASEVAMKRCFFLLLCAVLPFLRFPDEAGAQLTQDWVRSFHVPGGTLDEPVTIATDDSGYVYVIGVTKHPTRDEDVLWLKYTMNGSLVGWTTWAGPNDTSDIAVASVVSANGKSYITGRTYSGPPTGWDYLLIRLDADGTPAWSHTFDLGWDNVDYGRDIKLDADGNLLIVGQVWDEFVLGIGLVKYTPGGTEIWRKSYHQSGTQVDDATALACDASGNIYVCGWTSVSTEPDILTMKLDADGDTLWTRRYDGPANGYDAPIGIVVDDSGGVYVAGNSNGAGSGSDIVVIKYDSLGTFRWARRLDGGASDADYATGIVLAPNGTIYVSGELTGSGTYFDGVVMRCRPDGQSIGGNFNTFVSTAFNYDDFVAVAADADSRVFAVGASVPSGVAPSAVNIRQYEPVSMGEDWGDVVFGDSGNAYGVNLCLDHDGNLYVTARAYGGAVNGQDLVTARYLAAPVAVFESHSDQIPATLELYQNAPNPFNSSTVIRFDFARGGNVELAIFNILGQRVLTHAENGLPPGRYTFEWDGRDQSGRGLPSGVYIYRLATNGMTEARKMAMLK